MNECPSSELDLLTDTSSAVPKQTTRDLLKLQLNPSERRSILRSLALKNWSASQNTLNQIMPLAAEHQIRHWLQKAPSNEREIALAFLHKAASNKILCKEDPKMRKLLHNVKGAPEASTRQLDPFPNLTGSSMDGGNRLKHVVILTPRERKNRWIHTTWHHLPPYHLITKPSRNEHQGAIYEPIFSKKLLQYVIHPELG